MLSINEIQSYYPKELQTFKRFILREYLQYKILAPFLFHPKAVKKVLLFDAYMESEL